MTRERRDLRRLTVDGVMTQAMGALAGGPFLVAYAASIGGSNLLIGFLGALPFLAQLLQLPAALLVSRVGRRRPLVLLASVPGRLAWLGPALAPWLTDDPLVLGLVLVVSLSAHFGLSSVAACAYGSWVRDVVPEALFGRHFGRQLALGAAVSACLRLAAGPIVDGHFGEIGPLARAVGVLFGLAAGVGLVGTIALRGVADPPVPAASEARLRSLVLAPARHRSFRPLLIFGAAWSFAINLSAPFVTLYMLDRLALSMTWILGLSVLSKLVNAAFFPLWGRIADRFAHKSILGVSVALSIVVMAAWPFTTLPDRHSGTIPLLVLIHVLAGVSTAGVTLGLHNLALELAPRRDAAPFLAAHAVACGVASAIAPLVAGVGADLLGGERLRVSLAWFSDRALRLDVGAIDLVGLDFLFVASALLGLYALHRLSTVVEQGEVGEREVIGALYGEMRQAVREVSTMSGLHRLAEVPSSVLRWATLRGEDAPAKEAPGPVSERPDDERPR